jgi:putative ABC transport system permease protein
MGSLRYALRALAARPGFCLTAVVTLALGIGANSAIFSAVHAILIRPLPFADPGRLVSIWQVNSSGGKNPVSPRSFDYWRSRNRAFEDMAMMAGWYYTVTGRGDAEQVLGSRVSANFFRLLGREPALGRGFAPGEDQAGAPDVAILSHEIWQRRYAGDNAILGGSIPLNGVPHEVVGIMPPGFRLYAAPVEVWTPAVIGGQFGVDGHRCAVLARLRPGVSIQQAVREMESLAASFGAEYPNLKGWGVRTHSLREELTGASEPALWALLAAAGLVYLIACANVANLLVARAASRGREVAIRAALGAGRGRIATHLLAESAVLSLGGTAAALALAWGGLRALRASDPSWLPRVAEIGVDPAVITFTLLLSGVTTVVFTLAPMRLIARADLVPALQQGSRGSRSSGLGRSGRTALVTGEVALSLMLMIGAGLLLKNLARLETMDRGWNPEGLLSFQTNLPPGRYPAPPALASMQDRILARIAALPGVESAGATTSIPLDGQRVVGMFYSIAGESAGPTQQRPSAPTHMVSAGYFRAAGLRLAAGRLFTERDDAEAPLAILVSRSLERRHWPGGSAIGRRLVLGQPAPGSREARGREIVGVVEDIQYPTRAPEDSIEIYVPFAQSAWRNFYVLARVGGDPAALAPAVRAEMRSLDPELAVYDLLPMRDLLARVNGRSRWSGGLFGLFALLAVALAVVGIYGVISYSVGQRVQEIGVRMALGAEPRDILARFMREGLAVACAGVMLGLAGYVAASRLLATLLHGISPLDAGSIAGAAALVAAIALLAILVPASRAARVNPVVALRAE